MTAVLLTVLADWLTEKRVNALARDGVLLRDADKSLPLLVAIAPVATTTAPTRQADAELAGETLRLGPAQNGAHIGRLDWKVTTLCGGYVGGGTG